jgi:hypothetical protein
MDSYYRFGSPLMVMRKDRAQYRPEIKKTVRRLKMRRQHFHRTALLLALAALTGFAGAAGPTGQAVGQAGSQAAGLAIAMGDNDSLYDYRSVSEGGAYYAPGSYASWYYVAPPAIEVASTTEPEAPAAPEYRAPPRDVPTYYDYDRYFGPLFG